MGASNNLIRLDPNKLAGLELEKFAPYPDETILSGKSEHERWQFDHDELFVGAYQARPAKLVLDGYPYDEFMYLLSGKIEITDQDGNLESFLPGQALVLKKGFTGTFEMIGNVRKIAIVAGEQYSPPT
ncbi:MAG: DUF861 domain-containing protein [Rhodospirillaceae bacterium]|jgi:uncharacterized protein|nr:DUF861 domain-containing protein [Rhodospirillaceae bacterium]MBT6193088.1 DUF861 domain-containing protein [Pseudomonadota bacterium]MBT7245814.1 DUF861 domain-containing protein [Pseudomonadota bacterium]MBT7561115.1 DUF861 domain-containing protein [Pseudomonadota bacterium]MBT7626644.1 DUF861 domain-containing protein [Pseudomonadota bacterium]